MSSLPGFQEVPGPRGPAFARSEAAPWVRRVLGEGGTLHGAAGRDPAGGVLHGRGPVYVIRAQAPEPLPAREHWAVRHYHRGGSVASHLGDRYLRIGTPRPFRELRASEEARSRGIPTPRVMAAAVYLSGAFYRGDLVTEYIPSSSDLAEALFGNRHKGLGGAVERLDALRSAGDLIRRMARAGIHHPDVNGKNILLEWKGAAPDAFLLDLDRCRVAPAGSSVSPGRMHRRLARSLRKWEGRTGLRLSPREWEVLEEAVVP